MNINYSTECLCINDAETPSPRPPPLNVPVVHKIPTLHSLLLYDYIIMENRDPKRFSGEHKIHVYIYADGG